MLLRNALRTPDGTVIESTFRHDYVTHTDANGKEYMVDGGLAYVRCSANGDEEMMTVESDGKIETARQYMRWGTYGKNGDQPKKRVLLQDMSNAHIAAILKDVADGKQGIDPDYHKYFVMELGYRIDNSIVIED